MTLSCMFRTDIKFLYFYTIYINSTKFGCTSFFENYERHNPKFKKLERYEHLPYDFDQLEVRT